MRRIAFAVTVVGILVALTPSGQSWASHGSGSNYHSKAGLEEKFFHKAHMILWNKDELGLSEEQTDQIAALKREAKKDIIRKSAEIDILKIDIRSKLYDNPVDVTAIHALIDQKYEIKKAKSKALVNALAKLKASLNEAQWKQLKALKRS